MRHRSSKARAIVSAVSELDSGRTSSPGTPSTTATLSCFFRALRNPVLLMSTKATRPASATKSSSASRRRSETSALASPDRRRRRSRARARRVSAIAEVE